MKNFVLAALGGVLAIALVVLGILYNGEVEKNRLLRSESQKTSAQVQDEYKKLKEDSAKEREKDLADTQKLLTQMTQATSERDKALAEAEDVKKRVLSERELSIAANDDMNVLRNDIDKLRSESKTQVAGLESSYKKKVQGYETRILSLEAALDKAKKRLSAEAERYHYNLGVLYTQNKDYDQAAVEFRTALGYNPKNAQAHYNLGIIYDDYFKDKDNAEAHYRAYLELDPTSDDADSVREWLANLEKK